MSKLENFVKSLFDFKRIPKEGRGSIGAPECTGMPSDVADVARAHDRYANESIKNNPSGEGIYTGGINSRLSAQTYARYKTDCIKADISRADRYISELKSLLNAPLVDNADKANCVVMRTNIHYTEFLSGEKKDFEIEITFNLNGEPLCAEILGDENER